MRVYAWGVVVTRIRDKMLSIWPANEPKAVILVIPTNAKVFATHPLTRVTDLARAFQVNRTSFD